MSAQANDVCGGAPITSGDRSPRRCVIFNRFWTATSLLVAPVLFAVAQASATDVALLPAPGAGSTRLAQITKLIVTGTNFRYTWERRRGWELSSVEQPGIGTGDWWNIARVPRAAPPWQRVNSSFAWKSLDTIPALSFSTRRGAYYSGEWNIAYANADRDARINILRNDPRELVFETVSHPKILENQRLSVPWEVRQVVRVFDSGVILTRIEAILPKGEVYELDWAQMSVNLDDWLYKEPHPDRQQLFAFHYAFPGEDELLGNRWKHHLQDMQHLPLDIDVKLEQTVRTGKPILFASAGYDLTHVPGAGMSGFAECCLEEARSLIGTRDDFGSLALIRPNSGMSPVPTWAGSMRNNTCFSVHWNLFDGKTAGLNEPLAWKNTLALAFASRKRTSRPDASADDRNLLLGARVYWARDKLPSADEIKAIAADGCDTLILGTSWRKDESATRTIVQSAHAAGLRLGATVEARDLQSLVSDGAWFSRLFEKNRDGLYLAGANFLTCPAREFSLGGDTLSFKSDGAFRANAAPWAICMRALRSIVGERGFLIGEEGAMGPTLLSLAEFDLHATMKVDPYRGDSPAARCARRYRSGAGFAPVVESLSPDQIGQAAMHADTPLVLWPANDRKHLAWWDLCRRIPAGGCRVESDLLPGERRFTTSSGEVHGAMFDSGTGKMLLLLSAQQPGSAKVTLAIPGATVRATGGTPVAMIDSTFDAGAFAAWEVKAFDISAAKEAGK